MRWFWTNEITAIEGNRIRLKKPLRIETRPEWPVTISAESPFPVTDSGVENLTIRFPDTRKAAHLREPGWNGVIFHKAAHCWARNLVIHNADVGISFTTAINCQASGWTLTGRENHHATATRVSSHDNRVEEFRIESRPHHGLNTEGLSRGPSLPRPRAVGSARRARGKGGLGATRQLATGRDPNKFRTRP